VLRTGIFTNAPNEEKSKASLYQAFFRLLPLAFCLLPCAKRYNLPFGKPAQLTLFTSRCPRATVPFVRGIWVFDFPFN
jgi:hypothetical protein